MFFIANSIDVPPNEDCKGIFLNHMVSLISFFVTVDHGNASVELRQPGMHFSNHINSCG